MTVVNWRQFIRPGQTDENTQRLKNIELHELNENKSNVNIFGQYEYQNAFFYLAEKSSVVSRQKILPIVTINMMMNQNHRIT